MTLDSLGGYRLVRKLGEGARAEVFLGHPQSGVGETQPSAIKVFRAGVSDESIIAEIEALSRANGVHVVGLVDVTTAPDGAPALILERLPGGSLGRLVRSRESLRLGEVITILAPLAGAVARMHRDGVTHGAVGLDSVLFNRSGAPVLACFGRSRLIEPNLAPARLEAEPGVATDIAALASFATGLFDLVDDRSAEALAAWVHSSDLSADDWIDGLIARLFDVAEPEPIRLDDDRSELDGLRFGRREVPVALAIEASPAFDEPESGRGLPSWIPGWLAEQLPEQLREGGASVLTRVRASLSLVRKRVWVLAGVVAITFVAATVTLQPGQSDATQKPDVTIAASSTAAPRDTSPVMADDPVAALLVLLDARERCIRDLSVLCLDDVDQQASAALAADQALVSSVQSGEAGAVALAVGEGDVTVTERLGNSALLRIGDGANSEPASILLMKGEAGWRIRDYLDAPGAG